MPFPLTEIIDLLTFSVAWVWQDSDMKQFETIHFKMK